MPLRPGSLCLVMILSIVAVAGRADSRSIIDHNTGRALDMLRLHSSVAGELLDAAAGVLVFSDIVSMDFAEGGHYGEGSLLVGAGPVAYYATAHSASGSGRGEQGSAEVILFMTQEALRRFRSMRVWEVGVNGSVAPVKLGPGGIIDSGNLDEPLLGVVFVNKDLSYNLSLEGSKITRISR